ncbi:ribonuclease III [uncultured Selenomonas sp.]|uniref:ribonuclease III n=1 Tax=uncultured Selenomonas sp. TaxID=159275 RepID=UPI0028ED953B|nr:ribonuclease III [uncultured Selenomonas sp.]
MKKASEVLSKTRREALRELSDHLGIEFQNIVLLHEALTHTSYANESKNKGVVHNERLEFLGDAVLELATSTYLFERFPKRPEGELTKARASIVREATLSRRAAELKLGEYLLLGHGEASMGGGHRPSMLADAFEAVIGAIYLDCGWQTAYDYVLKQLHGELLTIDSGENMKDYKTTLQEVVQKHVDSKIAYELLAETGPDHDKTFEFAVRINDAVYGTGKGRNKKEAEQGAAREALRKMKKL